MILIDVNILVYAKRHDSPNHPHFRTWLEETFRPISPSGFLDQVPEYSVVRVLTTSTRGEPDRLDEALAYVNSLCETAWMYFDLAGSTPLGDLHSPLQSGWSQRQSGQRRVLCGTGEADWALNGSQPTAISRCFPACADGMPSRDLIVRPPQSVEVRAEVDVIALLRVL